MRTSHVLLAALALLALLAEYLGATVHASGLRAEIAQTLAQQQQQAVDMGALDGAEDTFVIDFNSSQTNVTNPYEEWKQLPDWLRYLSGSVIVLIGLIITFYGVRLLPLSVFILGGFVLALFMFGILASAIPNSDPSKTAIVYGTSFSVWVVGGVLLACCISLAVFILGFALGAVVALILNPILLKYIWPAEPLANTIIWVVIFGLIGGVIAYCLKRPLLIVATSAGGSFAVITAIQAMVGTITVLSTTTLPTSWQDWAAFGGIIGLTVFGILIQLFCTASDLDENGYAKMD